MEKETERKLDLAHLDAILKYLEESPILPLMERVVDDLASLKEYLMDPPKGEDNGRLKTFESIAKDVGSMFSLFNPSNKYRELMTVPLAMELSIILSPLPGWLSREPQMNYSITRPKPSRFDYRRTGGADIDRVLKDLEVEDEDVDVPSLLEFLHTTALIVYPSFEEVDRHLLFELLEDLSAVYPSCEQILDLSPLLELLENLPAIYPLWEQIDDDIALLKAILMDLPQQFVEYGIAKLFLGVICVKGELITSSSPRDELEKVFEFMSTWMSAARRIYEKEPKPSRIYYPTTAQLGFVDHLVEYLEALVMKAQADNSFGPLKPYILRFQRKLRSVSCRLMDIPEARKEEADLKYVMTSITNLAYEVEFSIDSFLVRDIPIWWCVFRLTDILQEFKPLKRQIKMESGDTLSIISSILENGDELKIIPIVSNAKITKKLMNVFSDPGIVYRFPICLWSLVSSYKERKKEVLLDLLHNASYGPCGEDSDEIAGDMSENDLERSVFNLLNCSTYFIILEDVGDINTLNDIRRVLPDNLNGSRVLLTTPSSELALQCRYGCQNFSLFGDHTSTSQTNKPITNDGVVGFKDEIETMLERLTSGPAKMQIISITGMPGQGKTTLMKKLYSDYSVVNYFDACAWCYVSQVYEKRLLLLELLGQVVQHSDAICHANDEELAEMLYKSLKGQRFLIVLDDMWTIRAWNDLRRCFPNDNNGSRVIFTTRLQELASQAQRGSILQPLGPLSDDESWVLLEKKLFQKERCPSELVRVGRKIAKKCKGLPLSVVLAAGFLAKMEKKVDQWEHIVETLTSCILGDAETQSKGVIELSYKNLPDHLKACFLYFGAFLEDREIQVWKLIRLWIAEGFIKHNDLKNLEDIAEDYLTDLIERSLVIVSQAKSIGGVKSCRVHDLLREFCLTKAGEENISQLVCGYDEHFSSSNDNQDYGMNSDYSSTPIIYHLRRLCIYSKGNHFVMLKPSGPLVRSLLFFASNDDTCPSESHDISFISHNFKLLKILNLEGINIKDSFEAIGMLILLRYLAVQGCVDCIPSSIANLCNLETFLVKGLRAKIVKVPDSIWDLSKLRHVHIHENGSFDVDPCRLEDPSILDNLQTFSTPSLAYGDDMEKIMRRLRCIRKLKCMFLDSWDDATNCNKFPELGFLNKLVSLKVFYKGEGKYPCQFSFPSNLKKLTLSNFRLPWKEISQLTLLSNLEVLKLLSNACEGERWEMEDEVFEKLKFLELDTLDVVEWRATSDHFPRLERLLLHKCEQLEEIPSGIGDVPTLQMVEVMWCSPSVAISAKAIGEAQLEYGNDELKIHIYPKVSDVESSS